MAKSLSPFFRYFGSKRKMAKRYPAPKHELIIEPFAGSAGYSLHWYKHEIVLVERDPLVASLWQFLLNAHESDIEVIPDNPKHIDEVEGKAQKYLIALWWQWSSRHMVSRPPPIAKLYPERFWGPWTKEMIQRQLPLVKHWKVMWGNYSIGAEAALARPACYFIDPPYQVEMGAHYAFNSRRIDFKALGRWCESREGQVIVCEAGSADWLPFRFLHRMKTSHGQDQGNSHSDEVIWTKGCD